MRTRLLWPILIVVFVLFSLSPSVYELSRAGSLPKERRFELVHNFYTDYNFYLSRIREGLSGRWTVVEKYTSEPHDGSLIHEMYLLMGQMGRSVRVPEGMADQVYHIGRAMLALVLVAAIAAFSGSAFPSSQGLALMAFLLAMTASSWPKLVLVEGLPRFGGYMPWWSVMDSLQRITFIPHLLAGQALLLFLIMAATNETVMKRTGNAIFLGVLGFVLGMILPPAVLFLYAVLAVYAALTLARFKHNSIGFGIIGAVSVPSLIYLLLMTSLYPWKRLAELDVLHPLPFSYVEYALAVGPMLPLGLIGGAVAWIKKEKALYPSLAWMVAWLLCLVLFHFVPQQSPLRFSEMVPHVPLGILAAYVCILLVRKAPKSVRSILFLIPTTLIVVGVGQMASSYLWQKDFVDHKIRASVPLVPTGSYVMYPLKDFAAAIGYLQDKTERTDIILSETTAGNYIPVYIGDTAYVGHDNTVDAERKKALVKRFYAGEMTPDEAKQWVTAQHFRFVFFGPQEMEDGAISDLSRVYPFLVQVYKNSYVRIYDIGR
jgi:hypothetical protein